MVSTKKSDLLWYVKYSLLSAGAAFLLFGVLFGIAVVNGDSMLPNLHHGQIVFFNRIREPIHGDVVIVKSDAVGEVIIKRVIGLPGDVVEIKGGIVYRNGERIEEQYIILNANPSERYPNEVAEFEVPENSLFVLGDNRPGSLDSRVLGCLSMDDLIGVSHWENR